MMMPNSRSHCSTMISFEILLWIAHCIRFSFIAAVKATYILQYVLICTCSQPQKAIATMHVKPCRDTQKMPKFCLLLLLRLCVPMSWLSSIFAEEKRDERKKKDILFPVTGLSYIKICCMRNGREIGWKLYTQNNSFSLTLLGEKYVSVMQANSIILCLACLL